MAERRTAIQLNVAAGVKRISWVSNLSIDELREALARGVDATRLRIEALGELLSAARARFLVMRARCKLQGKEAAQ